MAVSVEKVSSDQALWFWQRSPQATVFNHPAVALRLAGRVDWWRASKGETPFLLWPVAFDEAQQPSNPPFSYYFGPMWSPEAAARAATSQLSDALTFYGAIADVLVDNYPRIGVELHHTLQDVRFFDWWNYGVEGASKFMIRPRYSAIIRGLQQTSEETVRSGYRELRRRELRKAHRDGDFVLGDKLCKSDFERLRSAVFSQQNSFPEPREDSALAAVFELVQDGWGRVAEIRDRSTSRVVAAGVVLEAAGTSNLVLSATDPQFRKAGLGAALIDHLIVGAKQRGNHNFDFNGANSPSRGDDKHSYGAEALLYFQASLG